MEVQLNHQCRFDMLNQFNLTYLPTKFSNTELFPALCPPTTAIWGRARLHICPIALKASCNLLTKGMSSSIPWLPMVTQPRGCRWLKWRPASSSKQEGRSLSLWPSSSKHPLLLLYLHYNKKDEFTVKGFIHSLSSKRCFAKAFQQVGLTLAGKLAYCTCLWSYC